MEMVNGNQLIQTQRDGDQVIKYIREFDGEQIKVVCNCLNIFQFKFSLFLF